MIWLHKQHYNKWHIDIEYKITGYTVDVTTTEKWYTDIGQYKYKGEITWYTDTDHTITGDTLS